MFKLSSSSGDLYPDRLPPAELSRGLCRDHEVVPDPSIFYGEDHGRGRVAKKTRQARLVCATCPVQGACRTYGLDAAEPYGVWGGLDRFDRAFVLGQRPTTLVSASGRPMARYSVPCDRLDCDALVPLARAGAHLRGDGSRLCSRCLLATS